NPAYRKMATEGERFDAYVWGRLIYLCNCYEFVRLLKTSKQTTAVAEATDRLEALFDEALRDMAEKVDLNAFEMIDPGALARVQLGSGLIVLNSLLESRTGQ